MTFAQAFTAAIAGRRHGDVGRDLCVSAQTVQAWAAGTRVPMGPHIDALGDLFGMGLARIAADAIARRCGRAGCRRRFYPSSRAQRFCMPTCADVAYAARRRGSQTRGPRLGPYQEAIAAMCRACRPDTSTCADGSCPLRPVSPFPLVGGS